MAIFAALLVFPTESKGFFFSTPLDELAIYSKRCWRTETAESVGWRLGEGLTFISLKESPWTMYW